MIRQGGHAPLSNKQNSMKILILGATGRTGKYLVKEALNRGFEVNILVRDSKKVELKSEKLNIFEGDTTNIQDLKTALTDCKSVLSALNISRNSDFPWSKLRTPKDFLEKTVQNIIEVGKIKPIEKVILISAWGVSDTKQDLPFWFRWLIENSNIRYGYLGHEQQENLLKNSNLNWTSVRPVGLTNFEKNEDVITSINNFPKPNLTISRKSVAQFMLKILGNKTFDNQTVTIFAK
jgi:nucleoside-diphosphate-sugar epimerase